MKEQIPDTINGFGGMFSKIMKDGTISLKEKEFIARAIPLMFEPAEVSQWRPLFLVFIEWGIAGYIIIALLIFTPLAVIFYLSIRWRQGSSD